MAFVIPSTTGFTLLLMVCARLTKMGITDWMPASNGGITVLKKLLIASNNGWMAGMSVSTTVVMICWMIGTNWLIAAPIWSMMA